MSRLSELQARREMLLARCEAQRVELSQRASHLQPWLRLLGAGGGTRRSHPLGWIATLAGLLLLGRFGNASKVVRLTRRAVSVASRTAFVLSLLRKLRGALVR